MLGGVVAMRKNITHIFLAILVGLVFYSFSQYNYLFFHTTIELFTMLVGMLIFTVSNISKKYSQNSFLINLGPGIFIASLIIFLHMLAYKGMGVIIGYDDGNLPTQLWIVSNYILSAAILIAVRNFKKTLSFNAMTAVYGFIGFVACVFCFVGIFPVCYVEGMGLTAFKKISEYIIIFIYALAIYQLYQNRWEFSQKILYAIRNTLLLLMVSGFMFTLYPDVFGIENFMGHYARLLAFFTLYIHIVVEGIQNPYNTVFANLNKLSSIDDLTHLYNHRSFQSMLEKHREIALQESKFFYLILFDIDNFKNINDTYGHLIGDEVLVETAQIIKSNIRSYDSAFRHGGDEFAVILYNTSYETAKLITTRITDTLAAYELTSEKICITLSGGAVIYSGESLEELIKKTDRLLYRAKKDGRNRVYFESEKIE